jgi:cell division protein FtsN
MAGNRPARERFDFSLDSKQVASVILGSLGALGLAFFLGHALGQRVSDRPAPVARAAAVAPQADPLGVLDRAPRAGAGEAPAQFSFHETLTSAKPPQEKLLPGPRSPSSPAAEQKPAPVVVAAPAESKAAPAESKAVPQPVAALAPSGPVQAGPVAVEARKATPAPASPSAPPRPATIGKGAWVVQVGSTQDRIEAERIASRFATRGARVVVADVPGKGRWYRVRLGSFETRESADRYLRDLERGTGAKGFVATAN